MTSTLSLPASIFEKSRMSLMTVSSDSPDDLTMSRYSRCSAVRSVPSASSVMPMTPFIGVRISWLMLARNSLFARLAASAASSARCPLDDLGLERLLVREISSSASFRSWISVQVPNQLTRRRAASRCGTPRISHQRYAPSARRSRHSSE